MNPMKAMKQFQQLQEQMQQELERTEVSASAGGEMVTVRMNGRKEVLAIAVDPQVVDKDDVEMLQDLIVAAVNECARRVDDLVASKLSGLAGKLQIPGL